jgi:hypothetical protein
LFWFRLRWRRRASYADEIYVSEKSTCPEKALDRSRTGLLHVGSIAAFGSSTR